MVVPCTVAPVSTGGSVSIVMSRLFEIFETFPASSVDETVTACTPFQRTEVVTDSIPAARHV